MGAKRDPEAEAAVRQKREAGIEDEIDEEEVASATPVGAVPAAFDIATKWPKCKAIFNQIQDQSNCGSCWAVSTASIITDRRCIKWAGVAKPRISAWDLVGCCANCRATTNGCEGGYTSRVMDYYVKTGIVTGNGYGGAGCKPYRVAPGALNQPGSTPCATTCQKTYKAAVYAKDKKKGGAARIIQLNNTQVQAEIFARGSVVAQFAGNLH